MKVVIFCEIPLYALCTYVNIFFVLTLQAANTEVKEAQPPQPAPAVSPSKSFVFGIVNQAVLHIFFIRKFV